MIEAEFGKGLRIDEGIIIPRKGVVELRRVLEGVEGACDLAVSEGSLVIRANDIVVTVRLVDAKFPPYEQVVPKNNEKILLLDRVAFLESMKRISIISPEKNKGIRLDVTAGRLRISSTNADLGEAQEDVDVEYDGESLSVGFDARYFVDILNEMDDERVVLELSGELDPGLVRGQSNPRFVGVIMPMRL
jgi:DNA polymerase-3 subunit beta